MDTLEARDMAFGTLVSRSKFYKNPKVVGLVNDLKNSGIIDKFYDEHFTPGVIKRTEYINHFLSNEFSRKPDLRVLTVGCGFNTYYDDVPHAPNAKWVDSDLNSVTTLRYTHWGESHDPTKPHHLVSIDLNALGSMAYLESMANTVDVLLAEGVLMYIPKERARQVLELPWKNMVFDVLGANRKIPMGKNHLWKYEYNEWLLPIDDRYQFDGRDRDSWIYTAKR
jgi:O-methyltransferase involved in polyketide biosynthesis